MSQKSPVVVGYDGSEHSRAALAWAATEAQRRGRPLSVLHVLDYAGMIPGPMGPFGMPIVNGKDDARIAESGAERARQIADATDITAVTRKAPVAATLIEFSERAELLVLGTRGHGDLTGTVLGSVAFAVSAHAHCPVVIARGGCEPPGPGRAVVVGVDGSIGSDQALRYAADLAAQSCAPLIIVSAYRIPTAHGGAEAQSDVDSNGTADFATIARTSAQTVVTAAVQIIRQTYPQLHLSEQIHEARPALALIIAAGARAGLLVVGSRGNDGFAGLKLGSVAHALIHSAPCPVVIVPETTLANEPSVKTAAESAQAGLRPGIQVR
jgi:nucleotide-binding universal stress UspA family protein